ncbi:MAG: DUF6029 family protein [Bacteroidota bacterium]|nr:DUF6029 family protein [Bacteroidota bacterium]MDP4231245.1 DUF6029 family protein [Bacteroidota bacterium]MDP4235366.1 DUF6029 family protein [Bacteroidota bacterium]
MKKILSLLLIVAAITIGNIQSARSQVSAVGSNLLRIGDGKTDDPYGGQIGKSYLEEIANARIFYDNITLGLRYELDDPSEVGPSFQGLRRRWIEYHKDKLNIQAGDVYALYGRGLAMNAFEARPLNYDSWLDGVKGEYEYLWKKEDFDFKPSLGVRMIAGKLSFHDVVDTNKPVQNVSARAVNGQLGLFGKKVIVGASYLQASTTVSELTAKNGIQSTDRIVNQPDVYLNVLAGSVEGFLQFTEMRSMLDVLSGKDTSISNRGKALYGSISYAGPDLGLTIEYKNYSYFVHAPGADNDKYFSKLPISNPPEVYKEFTYTSLTRTTHNVNFDDELGFEIEANITAIPEYTITLNCAASSRHNSYGDSLDANFLPVATGSTSVMPKLGSSGFFPFWEAFTEVEHDFGELNYAKAFFHRRSNVIAFNGKTADVQRSTTVGAKVQYATAKSQSLLAIYELQWMYDTEKLLNDHRLTNQLLTLQYSFNPIITFGGVFDYSTQNEGPRHFWPQGFLSFRIGGSHTVLASYGAERGGLNCTGGICRVVPAFNGLRVTLTSQI